MDCTQGNWEKKTTSDKEKYERRRRWWTFIEAHSVPHLAVIWELSQKKLERDILHEKNTQSRHNLFSPWPWPDQVHDIGIADWLK